MNLKPEELVKALRYCSNDYPCKTCPVELQKDESTCIGVLFKHCIDQIERDQKEIEELREKQQWIPVAERPPEELVLVNVVWVNRVPEPYYKKIKGVPFSGTACFFEGRWYWDSPIVLDMLSEYGKDDPDLVDDAVDITHWMPLLEPTKEDV
jgi:hypothetical protein